MDPLEKQSSWLEETKRKFEKFVRGDWERTQYANDVIARTETKVKELQKEWKKTRAPESSRLKELKTELYSNEKFTKWKELKEETMERKKVAGRFLLHQRQCRSRDRWRDPVFGKKDSSVFGDAFFALARDHDDL